VCCVRWRVRRRPSCKFRQQFHKHCVNRRTGWLEANSRSCSLRPHAVYTKRFTWSEYLLVKNAWGASQYTQTSEQHTPRIVATTPTMRRPYWCKVIQGTQKHTVWTYMSRLAVNLSRSQRYSATNPSLLASWKIKKCVGPCCCDVPLLQCCATWGSASHPWKSSVGLGSRTVRSCDTRYLKLPNMFHYIDVLQFSKI
jgi:hypothetical protein